MARLAISTSSYFAETRSSNPGPADGKTASGAKQELDDVVEGNTCINYVYNSYEKQLLSNPNVINEVAYSRNLIAQK